MIFNKMVHWADGLFLQPHHLQQMQKSLGSMQQKNIELSSYYSYGLIDFCIVSEALDGMRVVIKRLSAIMPNGLMVSMPGNLSIEPLTIDASEHITNESIMVYLAIPYHSDIESNLSQYNETKLYSTKQDTVRDENSGDNEIVMLKRVYNGKIVTNTKNEYYNYLPLCRLVWVSKNINEPKLCVDSQYIAPYYLINDDCELKGHIAELMYAVSKKTQQIIKDLSDSGYNTKKLAGASLFNVLQLSILSSHEKVISSLLQTNKATPFTLYMHLVTMLCQLASLQPFSNREQIMDYSHTNLMPVFKDVITNIRSIIMAGGYTDYVQCAFNFVDDYYKAVLNHSDIVLSKNFYIAIVTSASDDFIREVVEQGDNFRLINEEGIYERIRGVKLKELRYPPRYLPVIPNALWFQLVDIQNSIAWDNICKDCTATIELIPEQFPDFKAFFFMSFDNGDENE